MPSPIISFALREESRPFQKLVASRSDVRVVLTGIGQQNAAKSICKALTEESTNFVLTCGFAGGLNPELGTGTVVFSLDEDNTHHINQPPTYQTTTLQMSLAVAVLHSWERSE